MSWKKILKITAENQLGRKSLFLLTTVSHISFFSPEVQAKRDFAEEY